MLTLLAGTATSLLGTAAGASAKAAAPAVNTITAGHAYRHGAVPTRAWLKAHPGAIEAANNADDLAYGGGISGVGVTTGPEQVYLVFWGSQWGTASTNSSGYQTYSGDSKGVAPDLQGFFKGLGSSSDSWSGVMTQYCQGVATGTIDCPTTNTQHVGYPTGGALAGVWEDTSSASPAASTAHQLAQEAENAATHFGNTTTASNRNTQYVIVSPTGTDPDSYETGGFCAWHDYSGDTSMDGGGAVSGSTLAFTNLPYIPDAGASCGQGFINSPGTLDGVTIVGGHEYAETITDQYPAGGWTTPSGSAAGEEDGDLCAWNQGTGQKAADITLSTGSYPVQATWGNDFNGSGGCEISHAIVGNGGGTNTVTVANPGSQTGTVGTAASLQLTASDSASGQTFTWTASGLPTGLSIASGTGLITGTPSAAGSFSVTATAKDTTGATGSTSFSWTINSQAGNTVTVTNPGSQSSTVGTAITSLTLHATDSQSGQTFTWTASGLPAGLSLSGAVISGTPTTAGTYSVTVTAKDTTGAAGSASFTWTVSGSGGGCTAKQLLGNPGFETGSAAPWTSTAGVINPNGAGETAHSGNYYAWLDGYGVRHTDTLAQAATVSSACHTDTFSFWLWIDTSRGGSRASDTLKVQVLNSAGTVLATLATYSNLNANNQYLQKSFSVSAYAGQKITLKFTGTEAGGGVTTDFVIDDAALNQAT